jgi:hypothetical protein
VVARAQRIAYAQIAAQADEAHVQYTRRTSEHITGHVDVTPCDTERPIPCCDTEKRNNNTSEKYQFQTFTRKYSKRFA